MNLSTRIAAALTAGLVASAACSSSSGPQPGEPLAVTSANAQAAMEYAAGVAAIPASCGASPAINCPGGNPGDSIPIAVTLRNVSLTQRAGADSLTFDWTADGTLVTSNIPITIPIVGACMVTIDSRGGADSTLHVTGTATFTRQTASGPIDQVDIEGQALTGLEASDVSLSGGIGCATASLSVGLFLGLLSDNLFPSEHLCSAPGPDLFMMCKE